MRHSEEDMLKVKNVGDKALGEIRELLQQEGLSLGMVFDDPAPDLVATGSAMDAPLGGQPGRVS